MLWMLYSTLATAGIMTIDVLDVGQGDAIVVQSPAGKTVLIDGGTRHSDLTNLLNELKIDHLNMIIATHPHADHIGGMTSVIDAFEVDLYVDSGMTHTTATYNTLMRRVEEMEIPYKTGQAGQQYRLDDDILIEILHPSPSLISGSRSDLNSNSVVARLTHHQNCFLFTGDAEMISETQMLQRGVQQCDILKVAHHGSNHSTGHPWLTAVNPQAALISAGRDNRYGHPGEETLQRLTQHHVEVFRTDQLGTIHIDSDAQSITISGDQIDSVVITPSDPHTDPSVVVSSIHSVTSTWVMGATQPQPDTLYTTTITDAMRTRLGVQPPQTPTPLTVPDSQPTTNDPQIVVNLATADELMQIPGIGPARAQAIIQYRENHGPFTSLSQLEDVHGIGPRIRQVISEHAVLNP